MSKPAALLVVGDFHTGSKVALCPEEGTELDDGDIYKPNPAQVDLYHFWANEFLPWVRNNAKGHRLILDHGGDAIDGATHHQSLQTFGTNLDAERLHLEMLEPLTNMADEMLVIRGSPTHVGRSSESDRRLAQEFGASIHWRYRREISGQMVDIRHHGSAGRRAWLRGNSLYSLMRHERFDSLDKGERPPDVVIRHHVHLFDSLTDWRLGMTGIMAPGWKMSDEYGYSLPLDVWSIGGAMYFFDGRRVESKLYQGNRP